MLSWWYWADLLNWSHYAGWEPGEWGGRQWLRRFFHFCRIVSVAFTDDANFKLWMKRNDLTFSRSRNTIQWLSREAGHQRSSLLWKIIYYYQIYLRHCVGNFEWIKRYKMNFKFKIIFLLDPGILGVRSMGPLLCNWDTFLKKAMQAMQVIQVIESIQRRWPFLVAPSGG